MREKSPASRLRRAYGGQAEDGRCNNLGPTAAIGVGEAVWETLRGGREAVV
jgi:hypothetical protein